jgi:hypothetical protein
MYRILSLLSVVMVTSAMDSSYSAPMHVSKPAPRHENMTITFHHQEKCKDNKYSDKSYSIAEGSCHAVPGENHLWYIVSIYVYIYIYRCTRLSLSFYEIILRPSYSIEQK